MRINNKFVAPNFDRLICCFDNHYRNSSKPSTELSEAIDKLFDLVKNIKPLKDNDEIKMVWIRVPRGDISDFGDYQEMLEYEEVSNYDEYLQLWKERYPNEFEWYRVVFSEYKNFKAASINNNTIINAEMGSPTENKDCYDEFAIGLIKLLIIAINDIMNFIKSNKYIELINREVPYKYRKGVIKRKLLWEINSEEKKDTFNGLSEETYKKFCNYIENGENSTERIGRIGNFTARDFFTACAIGYRACSYDGTDLPIIDQYLKHADGRDGGLTGRKYDCIGNGVDLDDSEAWNKWYNDRTHFGGHPWEVCRGGNSTHVSLYVSDYNKDNRKGYYFVVAGKSFGRAAETVNFYVAIKEAGYPIVIEDGDAMLARYKATDYVGIVPHLVPTRYCESLFDKKYGTILDFMHVYDDDLEKFGDKIEWIELVT